MLSSKTSTVKQITRDFGLQDITGIKRILKPNQMTQKTTLSDTIGKRPGALNTCWRTKSRQGHSEFN